MITIAVCGLAEVPFYAHAGITDIVSIGDPGMQHPDVSQFPNPLVIHRFEFTDICHVAPAGDKDVSPTREDVKQLIVLFLRFMAATKDKRILFHCTAGRARSTAAAFILCVLTNMTYEEAFSHIVRIRGEISPNLLMIKYADALMSRDGKMLDYIAAQRPDAAEWVRLEREKDAL